MRERRQPSKKGEGGTGKKEAGGKLIASTGREEDGEQTTEERNRGAQTQCERQGMAEHEIPSEGKAFKEGAKHNEREQHGVDGEELGEQRWRGAPRSQRSCYDYVSIAPTRILL